MEMGHWLRRDRPDGFQTLEVMNDHVLQMHRSFYASAGPHDCLQPMLFAVCKNGRVIPIMAKQGDKRDHQAFLMSMRKLFRSMNVVRYCWTGEAWGAFGGKDPATAENKVEAVFTVSVEPERTVATVHEIVRDWSTGRVISLRPMTEVSGAAFTDTMGNLWA